jgi:methylase of polypeptide subunit release factors
LSVCKQAKKIIFIECEPSACEVIKANAIENNFINEEANGKSEYLIAINEKR